MVKTGVPCSFSNSYLLLFSATIGKIKKLHPDALYLVKTVFKVFKCLKETKRV